MLSNRALTVSAGIGTVLQLAMVITGHFVPAVAALFAVAGCAISLVAGLLYVKNAGSGTTASHAIGGLVAGGVCALLGIAVSCALGDVQPMILVLGTTSSAICGALGGVAGHFTFGGRQAAAST